MYRQCHKLRLHSIIPSSPECQLLVRSSKLLEPKTTKDHWSLPHKSLVNSTPVLLTDHPAPTSEFSVEEEEEEEVNSNSTSKGDLDSDPAVGLLSPVLIRQQATATEEEGCSCQQEEEEYSQKPFHPGGNSSNWEGTKSSSCGSNSISHKRRQQQQGKEEDPTTTKCFGRSWTDWAQKNTDSKEELKDSNTSASHTTFDKA